MTDSRSFRPRKNRAALSRSFRKLSVANRQHALKNDGFITEDDRRLLDAPLRYVTEMLGRTIENCIGVTPVPLGIATNFIVNGDPRPIAMATEERTVIAAASKAAALSRNGFDVSVNAASHMRGQVLFSALPDAVSAFRKLQRVLPEVHQRLRKEYLSASSHATDITTATVRAHGVMQNTPLLVIEFIVQTGETMGAGTVTRIAEQFAAALEPYAGKRRTAAICSNDRAGRVGIATATWTDDALFGRTTDILSLQQWATLDPRRAVTHNKGIMNAISAVATATGQDVRAIEACAHAYAARDKTYRPLTDYRAVPGGLEGTLSLPLPVGIHGGATNGPFAKVAMRIMGIDSARDLAGLMVAAGLAQNLAALLSLSGEGIAAAHAKLARPR